MTSLGEHGCVIGGVRIKTGHTVEVRSPFDQTLIAVVHLAGPLEMQHAIGHGADAFRVTRAMPSWKRAEILESVSAGLSARAGELARILALEAGKPVKAGRVEVERTAFSFKVAAEEAKRIYGEIVPLDWLPGTERREAHVQRVPLDAAGELPGADVQGRPHAVRWSQALGVRARRAPLRDRGNDRNQADYLQSSVVRSETSS